MSDQDSTNQDQIQADETQNVVSEQQRAETMEKFNTLPAEKQ